MDDAWAKTVREKISELELIASWAGQVGYHTVRDLCRKALHDLQVHEKHRSENIAPQGTDL